MATGRHGLLFSVDLSLSGMHVYSSTCLWLAGERCGLVAGLALDLVADFVVVADFVRVLRVVLCFTACKVPVAINQRTLRPSGILAW